MVQRLSALPSVYRAYVVGGEPRSVRIDLLPGRLQAFSLSPLEAQQAIQARTSYGRRANSPATTSSTASKPGW